MCGHGVGVSRGEKRACPARAVAAVEAASPRAWGHPLCVCVPHSPAQAVECVCAARGAGKGRARRATLHRQAVDHRMRSTAWVSVCVRWPMLVVVRAPWSQKRCASWRKFVGGGGRVLPCGRDLPRAWQGVVWAVFFWGGHRARWGGGRGGQVCCTPWGSGPCVYRRRGSRLGCEVTRISTRERSQGPPSNVTMACIGLFGRGTHAAFVSELDEDDVCTHSLRRHLHLPKRRRNVTTDGTFANATARTGNHFLFELCRHPYREISLSCGERFPF